MFNTNLANYRVWQQAADYIEGMGFSAIRESETLRHYTDGNGRYLDLCLRRPYLRDDDSSYIVLGHTGVKVAYGCVWTTLMRLTDYAQIEAQFDAAASPLQRKLDELVERHGPLVRTCGDDPLPGTLFCRFQDGRNFALDPNGGCVEPIYWPEDDGSGWPASVIVPLSFSPTSYHWHRPSDYASVELPLEADTPFILIPYGPFVPVLLQNLSQYTLDPVFEQYGNFVTPELERETLDGVSRYPTNAVHFWGNFGSLSSVFRVVTNHPEVIAALTAAIRTNQQTEAYQGARANHRVLQCV